MLCLWKNGQDTIICFTHVAVSCFSSSIMESVAHGCVPLVYSPAVGARYSPDIEKECLGLISVSEEEFLVKLNEIIERKYKPIKTRWRN